MGIRLIFKGDCYSHKSVRTVVVHMFIFCVVLEKSAENCRGAYLFAVVVLNTSN